MRLWQEGPSETPMIVPPNHGGGKTSGRVRGKTGRRDQSPSDTSNARALWIACHTRQLRHGGLNGLAHWWSLGAALQHRPVQRPCVFTGRCQRCSPLRVVRAGAEIERPHAFKKGRNPVVVHIPQDCLKTGDGGWRHMMCPDDGLPRQRKRTPAKNLNAINLIAFCLGNRWGRGLKYLSNYRLTGEVRSSSRAITSRSRYAVKKPVWTKRNIPEQAL